MRRLDAWIPKQALLLWLIQINTNEEMCRKTSSQTPKTKYNKDVIKTVYHSKLRTDDERTRNQREIKHDDR